MSQVKLSDSEKEIYAKRDAEFIGMLLQKARMTAQVVEMSILREGLAKAIIAQKEAKRFNNILASDPRALGILEKGQLSLDVLEALIILFNTLNKQAERCQELDRE